MYFSPVLNVTLSHMMNIMSYNFIEWQVPTKTGTKVMEIIGIKAMAIMAIMVTVIKDTEDTVAMITLVTTTIMDMVTMTVSKLICDDS